VEAETNASAKWELRAGSWELGAGSWELGAGSWSRSRSRSRSARRSHSQETETESVTLSGLRSQPSKLCHTGRPWDASCYAAGAQPGVFLCAKSLQARGHVNAPAASPAT